MDARSADGGDHLGCGVLKRPCDRHDTHGKEADKEDSLLSGGMGTSEQHGCAGIFDGECPDSFACAFSVPKPTPRCRRENRTSADGSGTAVAFIAT